MVYLKRGLVRSKGMRFDNASDRLQTHSGIRTPLLTRTSFFKDTVVTLETKAGYVAAFTLTAIYIL